MASITRKNASLSLSQGRLLLVLIALSLCPACHSRSGADDSVIRGRYLVERVMMCGECHTPIANGQPDRTRWLEGGPLPFPVAAGFAKVAPPIAGLPSGWTRQQFIRFIETGVDPNGDSAKPPMPAYRLNADDAQAVAAYLISLGKPSQLTKY